MAKVKVAINGFGRIGRNFFRAAYKEELLDIVAINDITNAKTLAHLLKYDSVFRKFDAQIESGDDWISVDGKKIKVFAIRDPQELPWKELEIDIVIESTGLFRKRPDAEKHIKAGAKKVIITAPATDPDITIVLGVNGDSYDHEKHNIISNASCTTNCWAPIAKIINDHFKIKVGEMTTIHSYTNDQRILDLPHKDLRRARAAALSMIPTTTGAAKAIMKVIPELEGKLTAISIRVPTPNVSLVDFTAIVEKETTIEEVKKLIEEYANGPMKGILGYSYEPLVSTDHIGNPNSSTVDMDNVFVLGGNMVKILSWYDNEWGYSNRVKDLAVMIAEKF